MCRWAFVYKLKLFLISDWFSCQSITRPMVVAQYKDIGVSRSVNLLTGVVVWYYWCLWWWGNQIYTMRKCVNVHFVLWTLALTNVHVLCSAFCPGRQHSETAPVSTSLQALWFTSNTFAWGSEGHLHAPQLSLWLLHPLPGGLPRLDPLQSGATPTLLQDHPDRPRQRSQQEEHQALVTELYWGFNHWLFLNGQVLFLYTGSCSIGSPWPKSSDGFLDISAL